jgi:hypothetical protein
MTSRILIPIQTVGLLSNVIPDYYSHTQINTLFMSSGAPEEIRYAVSNKSSKVMSWLKTINDENENPLEVLGRVLQEFMDTEIGSQNPSTWHSENVYDKKRKEAREKIVQCLTKDGLSYSRGGYITKGGYIATSSLQENVTKLGLSAVEMEIKRALANVESDPLAAIHNAGCVLEASLKAYLVHSGIEYREDSDTLSNLWKKAVEHIGIHPKELDDMDLKKIASGLFSIVEGTMHLRNKKSAAHGKSEQQLKQNTIRPRHARLAIHATHTICAYVLELMEAV